MAEDFGAVYREFVAPVWRYARARLPSDGDAEDVTSEVFTQAVRSWDGFDSGRGSVGGWLMGIARHVVADWWRQRREVPSEEIAGEADVDDVEAMVLRAEGVDALRRHLGCLSDREREVLALRFGAELSSAEIGAVLGMSAPAARMVVYRAVGRLREVMGDDELG